MRTKLPAGKQKPQARERLFEKKKAHGLFKRRINRAIARFWILGGLIMVAIGSLSAIVFFTFFTVQDVGVSRKDFRADGEAIAKYTYNRYIGKNIFLLNRRSVANDIRRAFPETLEVEVKRDLPDTLRLVIATHPVAFRWSCERVEKKITTEGEIIEETIPEAYFVNIDGRITQPNPGEDSVFLIYEKSPCPKELTRRTRILHPETIDQIFTAKKLIEEIMAVKIDRAGYFRGANEIHLLAEDGMAFWIDFITPVEQQAEKLRVALTLEPRLKEPMDHFDLRVPDKIFYAPK